MRLPTKSRTLAARASPAGAQPHAPLGVYGITKAAVLGIAQMASLELAVLGVRVNALAPIGRTRMVAAALEGQGVGPEAIMPRDPDCDLYSPEHVASLVPYLVSPLCPFTGRLFGARADDVYVFDSRTASHHVCNGGSAWTMRALADALTAIPLQEGKRILGPMGGVPAKVPDDSTLAELRSVS